MSFVEFNLFGVYLAPIVVMMVAAYVVFFGLRRLLERFEVLERVWHPGLFELSLYLIILSIMVLTVARLHPYA